MFLLKHITCHIYRILSCFTFKGCKPELEPEQEAQAAGTTNLLAISQQVSIDTGSLCSSGAATVFCKLLLFRICWMSCLLVLCILSFDLFNTFQCPMFFVLHHCASYITAQGSWMLSSSLRPSPEDSNAALMGVPHALTLVTLQFQQQLPQPAEFIETLGHTWHKETMPHERRLLFIVWPQ